MSDQSPSPPVQTNEEVLEEEIEELERPPMKSWIVWGAATALLVVAVAVVAGFMWIDRFGAEARQAERLAQVPPVAVPLRGPVGLLDGPPDAFRWATLGGAASYVVVVRDKETGEVVIQRPVPVNYLAPTDVESANLVPGHYGWSVEARRADGSRMGVTEASFEISPTTGANGGPPSEPEG